MAAKKYYYKEIIKSVKSLIDSTPESEKFIYAGGGGLLPMMELPSFVGGNIGEVYGYGQEKPSLFGGTFISPTKERLLGLWEWKGHNEYHKNPLYDYAILADEKNIKKVLDIIHSMTMNTPTTGKLDYVEFAKRMRTNGSSFSSIIKEFEKLMEMSIEEVVDEVSSFATVEVRTLPINEEKLISLLYRYYSIFII
jgi:hypothetical protein